MPRPSPKVRGIANKKLADHPTFSGPLTSSGPKKKRPVGGIAGAVKAAQKSRIY